MELLIIWIITIIMSFVMEISSELRIFKDAADNGYKVAVNRISEFANQINPKASKVTLMSLLIPIVNIMGVFQRTIIYNNVRHMFLDQLSVIDSLIPMTKEEEEEYKQKPSTINALFLNIKSQLENEPTAISYTNEGKKNTIWFRQESETFVIVKTEGPISKLSLLEQRAKLDEILNEIGKESEDEISPEELEESIQNDNIPNQLSAEEKINKLNDMKSSILNEETEATITQQPVNSQKIIKK